MNIIQNTNFKNHNTSARWNDIKYIVIHYVGATGDAQNNVEYYNNPSTTSASADFFVGFNGDIHQYNPNPKERYCWAVGGGKQSSLGGGFYGTAKNANSVSIEMCVRNRDDMSAESQDWYFEDATVESAITLTKQLMQQYNIPAENVIRHFDVNGKICPNPFVFNHTTHTWDSFRAAIGAEQEVAPVQPAPAPPTEVPGSNVDTGFKGNPIIRDGQLHCNNFTGAGLVPDGIDGPRSRAGAVKAVQVGINMDYGTGLDVDGKWGQATEAALGKHTVRRGETQYLVTALEILLMQKGCNPGGVECPGVFGSGLEAAVRNYQNSNELTVDGIAGKNTFKSLIS